MQSRVASGFGCADPDVAICFCDEDCAVISFEAANSPAIYSWQIATSSPPDGGDTLATWRLVRDIPLASIVLWTYNPAGRGRGLVAPAAFKAVGGRCSRSREVQSLPLPFSMPVNVGCVAAESYT